MRITKYLAIMVLAPSIAGACMCFTGTTRELFDRSDSVFTGMIVESKLRIWSDRREGSGSQAVISTMGSGPIVTAIRVTEVFKDTNSEGEELGVGEYVFLVQDASSCMLGINEDVEYLIFGNRILRNSFTSDQCQGSRPKNDAVEMISELKALSIEIDQ